MKTRFNIICALLFLAVIGGIVSSFADSNALADFNEGRQKGWDAARNNEGYVQEWQFVDIIPTGRMAADTLYDAVTGEAYHADMYRKHVAVMMPTPKPGMEALSLAGAIGTACVMGAFWITFLLIIFSINRMNVFDDTTIRRIGIMGWCGIAMYACQWMVSGIPSFSLRRHVSLEGFEIAGYVPETTWLFIGLGLLLFSLVMKMGREIKQEQDLTI